MPEQITKSSLLAKVSNGYNAFERLLAPLSEEQMLASELNDGWSVKDNIAHITSWHRRLLELLQAAERRRAPAQIPGTLDDAEVDQINARFYQENKALALNAVLQQFRTTYIQVVAAIQALSDEDLTSTQRFDWLQGETLWQVVEGDTYGHYQEHTEIIQAWLERSQQHSSQKERP
ncbi:MAG: ClbS/DfsB family four-helix bundle protein [Chloroflexota bacterium]|nr:ClbS/DfsB family four-helix bundle protein [Chloroflexota bacterium]